MRRSEGGVARSAWMEETVSDVMVRNWRREESSREERVARRVESGLRSLANVIR